MMQVLENAWVLAEVRETDGALARLFCKSTGQEFIGQPQMAAGLEMLIPCGKQRSNRALSDRQRLTSWEKLGADHLRLHYGSIHTQHAGALDIDVRIDITLEEADLSFGVQIENHSPYTIEELTYPSLGGLARPQGQPFVAKTMQFQCGFNPRPLDDGFANPGYWGTDWPTQHITYPNPEASVPFMLLDGGDQGLYIGSHDPQPNLTDFRIEYRPGYSDSQHHRLLRDDEIPGVPAGFRVGVTRLPFLAPAARIQMPPVVLRPYKGDWHQGLQAYLKWRETWFQPVPRPRWLRDTDCWMTLHINSPEGCCRHRYTELPALMKEAKEAGVQVLQLIGWARGGQDGDEPYQDTDPLLGTRQELAEAIAQIQALGIRVLLMCKFKWADRSTPEFDRELARHALKDLFGNPVPFGGYAYQTLLQNLSGGSRREGYGMCHLSQGYRDIVLREFEKILALKPDGIVYDELANPMLLCFDPGHGHAPGVCHHVGSLTLARDFYNAAKGREDFLLAGEGPLDVMTQYYWGSYIRSIDGGFGDRSHVPVWKYMNPDLHIATCLVGFDDREMVNQCLTFGYAINYEPYNFKGMPADAPRTVGYAQQARRLRRALASTLWTGEFRHTVGVEAGCAGEEGEFIYSLFVDRDNGKRAVVVANQEREKALAIQVSLPTNPPAEMLIHRPEGGAPERYTGTVRLPPRSLAVLVEA